MSDDVEIVRDENNPEEEAPVARKKRIAEGGLSQPGKWVKRKVAHMKLDQNMMDDEIDLIALKVGVATDDTLTDFQKIQKWYMKEMEEKMAKLKDAVTQLHVDPIPERTLTDQPSRPTHQAMINVV